MQTTVKAIQFVLRRAIGSSSLLFGIFVLTIIFLSFTDILNMFVFKEILDSANGKETILGVGLWGLIILRLVLEVAGKVISRYSEYIWLSLDTKQLFYNYSAFLSKLSSFDLANFEDAKTHDLIWRAFNRFQWHIRYYLDTFFKLCSRVLELAASIAIFFIASPMGAAFIVVANIIPIYIRSVLGEQNFNIYKADSQTVRKYEYLQAMAVNRETLMEFKQFQGFIFLKDRLFTLYSSFTNKQMSQYKKQWKWLTLVDMLPVLALAWFLVTIVTMLQRRNMTAGTFVFLFTNIFIFSGALSKLSMHLGSLTQDAHFMLDAIQFFDVKQQVTFITTNHKQESELFHRLQKPSIILENVSFRYPNAEKFVLRGINLTIPYGQNIALIGENGAGKTTLVKLLLRIYDPTEGRILINGIDLKEIPESLLFKMYSTLFQSFGKFYFTIRENLELAAGRKLAEEEYIQALKLSNAWNYVKDFPKQLDQQLGPTYEDGIDLSGGQWQQLAIARALIRKAPILVLDEPTSAIDAKAETEIFDRLNNHTKANTLIFISHRFSTIKDAERIIVLDKGRLIEDGAHEELMENNEKYAKLYSMQAERYARE